MSAAAATSSAFAQTSRPAGEARGIAILGGAGWASHWDDETFLGNGPIVLGGVSVPVGAHFAVEGELAWAAHHRDAGYLIADGTPILATARLAYSFWQPEARARPDISGGIALVHSRGHFTVRSFGPDPDGFPVPGPEARQNWRTTQGGWEVGAGVETRGSNRLTWRPEVRWTATTTDSSFTPGSREPNPCEAPVKRKNKIEFRTQRRCG